MDRVMPMFRRALGLTPELDDASLLAAFVSGGDEEAFALLVHRHGPLVYGVCRRCLREPADAEDAFQATFLVLVRRAASIERPVQLANWLYGVALRAARKLRERAERVRRFEGARPELTQFSSESPHDSELAGWLDEEIGRLPEKYRTPVILCHLQGLTRREAAGRLGCPEGTLSVRLARALAKLRKGLTRRGVAAPLAALALTPTTEGAVPRLLVRCTVQIAWQSFIRPAAPVPSRVAILAEGVMCMFLLKQLGTAAAALMLVAVVGLGGVVVIQHAGNAPAIAADPTHALPSLPGPLRLTLSVNKDMRIDRLTLREGDDEYEMKTAAALERYLRRSRLDRSPPYELVIVAPADMKYADMVDVLDVCQRSGFGRVTVDRQNVDALAQKKKAVIAEIDALMARKSVEDTWQKYFDNDALQKDDQRKKLLEEAMRFYEKAIAEAKAARQDSEALKLQDAVRCLEQVIRQRPTADRQRKRDLDSEVRQQAKEALVASSQIERDRKEIQGRWQSTLIHDNARTMTGAIVEKFEWLVAGENLVTAMGGSPRLGSIQLVAGKDDSPPGMRFSYGPDASFSARYHLEGDMLIVLVPGRDTNPETLIVFRRVRVQPM